MPSRKRNKGQARKAKKAVAASAVDGTSQEILDLVAFSGDCFHGHSGWWMVAASPHARVRACVRFVNAYWDEWEKETANQSYGTMTTAWQALRAAYGESPKALDDEVNQKLLKEYFVAYGTEMTLNSVSSLTPCWKEGAGGTVATIAVLDTYDPLKKFDSSLLLDLMTREYGNYSKVRDAWEGCERSILRFYSKRSPCTCLDEKYAVAKSQLPKTGVCVDCFQRKNRRDLFICMGCKRFQYCSRECQVAHWPEHKPLCKIINDCLATSELSN